MTELQTLMDRNQQFASTYEGNLTIMPQFLTVVLACVDARVDPAHVVGLELGDVLVLRNAGGRVTRDVELDLGILWALGNQMAGDKFQGLSLAIMHHTDCGLERLVNPQLGRALSTKLGIDSAEIDALAITDHTQSIHRDIERLRRSSLVPNTLVVSGHMYDVTDGIMREIIAPAPLKSEN